MLTSKPQKAIRLALASTVSFALAMSPIVQTYAQTLPQNGRVIAGDAVISNPTNHALLVNQNTEYSIIEWDGFSVGASNQAHFNNGDGHTLNRVTSNSVSAIDGSLTATGSLHLINDNGVIIGKDGVVNTGGSFVASTLDIANDDFLNGADNLYKGDNNAAIVNLGRVTSQFGDIGFLAKKIYNQGSLTADKGTIGLAAGREILIRNMALNDGKFLVKLGDANSLISEQGLINAANVELRANGGNVYALAGNQSGAINATGVSKKGGRIFLTAGGGKITTSKKISAKRKVSNSKTAGGNIFINADLVNISGLLDATGFGGKGGNIDIGGKTKIALNSAVLDASGALAGKIQVGGEYQGGKDLTLDQVENVQTLTIDKNSKLTADTIGAIGDGGTVVAWADDTTFFNGTISAQAGELGGNGGLVETSGKKHLGVGDNALVNTLAANGKTGNWLLDPLNVFVSNVGGATLDNVENDPGNFVINATLINTAPTHVIIQADETVTFDAPVSIAGGGFSLTVTAGTNIFVNRDITTNNGAQTFNGDIVLGGDVVLSGGSGNITFNGTINGLQNFDVDTTGSKIFNGTIGNITPLLSLYAGFGGSVSINGGSVVTIGDQFYDDPITVNGATLLTASHTDADIVLWGGLTTTNANSDLTMMAGHDIYIDNDIQYSGDGNINLVAGWNGTTAFDVATFDAQNISTTTLFGNNNNSGSGGSVEMGDGDQTNSISVGSKDGNTRVYAHDLTLEAGSAAGSSDRFVQLGYYANGESTTGNIQVLATDDVELFANFDSTNSLTSYGTKNYAQIGHGGTDVTSLQVSGDILVKAAEDVYLEGWYGEANYAQIGHGGFNSTGNYSGKIDVTGLEYVGLIAGGGYGGHAQIGHGGNSSDGLKTGNVIVTGPEIDLYAGSGPEAYSQIGHGGIYSTGEKMGNITVAATNLLGVGDGSQGGAYGMIGHGGTFSEGDNTGNIQVDLPKSGDIYVQAGTEFATYSQIGHGGFSSITNSTGTINVNAGFIGVGFGGAEYAYSQIGHGGASFDPLSMMSSVTDTNLAGNIDVQANMIELIGGSFDGTHAQIGHGDVAKVLGGTRIGNINIKSDTEISVVDDYSKAWIGHSTSTNGGISDASLTVEAASLDQIIGALFTADVLSGENSLFSTDIIDNAMQGGDVKIVTTDSNLSIDGTSGYDSKYSLTLRAKNNDILLNNGNGITNAGSGDIILAAGQNFHNNSGSAMPLLTQGRFLVYSTDWDKNTKDGMTGGNLYNRSYDNTPPANVSQTGDQFIYTRQPILTITGDDTNVTYNGSVQTQTGFGVTGLVNGDALSVAMDNDPLLTGYKNAGSYNAGLVSHDGLSSIGYGFNIVQGNLNIAKKELNISTQANDKTYDGTNLATATLLDDRVAGDNFVASYGLATFDDKNVGTGKLVTLNNIIIAGADAGNYTLTISNTDLANIIKANLNVTAKDDSKNFDGLAYSGGAGFDITGFVAGETSADLGGNIVYSGTSQGAVDVGTYGIDIQGLTSGNYNISFANGQLTINKLVAASPPGENFNPKPPLVIECIKDIFLCEIIKTDPIQLSMNRALQNE